MLRAGGPWRPHSLECSDTVEIESCNVWSIVEGTMRPAISRSELGQFLRLLAVVALVLGGIGVAIGGGSSALELIVMR